jgi:hypothetical protein
MAQTLSNFDAVLKDYYEGYIRNVLNSEVKLLKLFARTTEGWSGRQIVYPIRSSRNAGFGFRADNAILPVAGQQGYRKSLISSKNFYGRIQITGPTMVESRDNEGAFARALSAEIEYGMEDFKDYFDVILHGDGTGTLAVIEANIVLSTVGNNTITVDTTRYLKDGMILGFIQGGVEVSHATVITVNTTTSVTVGPASAASALVIGNLVANSGDFGATIMGLLGLIDDGGFVPTLQGIPRASVAPWRSSVLNNGGILRPLSLDLIQRGVDIAYERGGGKIDRMLAHMGVRREYINLLTPDVRFEPLDLKGGVEKELMFNGKIPFDFDRHCQYNRIYQMDSPTMRLFVQQDFKWIDEDGSILRASAVGNQGQDLFEAAMRWMGELGTDAPARNTRIDDIFQVVETTVLDN